MNRPRRLRNFLTCIRCSIVFVPAAFAAGAVHAAEQQTAPALPSTTGSVFTMLLGLTAVLAIMAGIAWLFKRSGLVQRAQGNAVAKIIGGVSVGTRERVMVIEVADQWIVVGVAPGRVNTLATMPRQEHVTAPASAVSANFSSWLKNTIDKRNGSS
ncbi:MULTISPECIES: flagellar biosynthetic protein FliO [unclassified Herbaspirillum]|jgi:flagellar protein FliO/FliZ|uniref:flagellar biosynthetic protein FliO n=1 Tax=unclassified Herbaspirillum TaxID=2624150 RepID=UPI000E2E4B72|nr:MULTISPECIES: flagellar biosynthetic protein FliO [unclassified Herbaspirillum]RFB68719.1 flagellar biosynthetic protein FliO [Herbaspirillum sp. 3R-3a1]TFI05627.1 flagellar biosynthetic protein FliO [Herbaspirillum sp. 3R11]TFI13463.1 flagellar biosynthetic protein FliO [Herbaspirillum sp. 3R-11]TFI27505.1 flagellar biosynthetic protein FliO [Herbaspirillum sp. 3C11]